MHLVPVEGIRNSLGYDDMTDINAAITTALEAANTQLAARLSTDFERAEVTDIFYAQRPGHTEGSNHCSTEFRLSRGLISARPVTSYGFSTDAFAVDPATSIRFDLNKGIARDIGTRFSQQYVSFTYTAGFEPDDTTPELYKQNQVPKWLKEAAKLQVMINLADTSAITEAGVVIDTKVVAAQLSSMLVSYIRYAPVALLPL